MSYFKRTITFVALIVSAFVVLNLPYFKAQLDYFLRSPQPAQSESGNMLTDGTKTRELEPNELSIVDLGIKAPLIYVDEIKEDVFQNGLQKGIVHYPGTAKPGEPGNSYYFGHSSDFILSPGDYKTVFSNLPKISQGTIIKISDQQGVVYEYRVIHTKVVKPNDLSVLAQDSNVHHLTLQTSYPIGTALRRYIVTSELIE